VAEKSQYYPTPCTAQYSGRGGKGGAYSSPEDLLINAVTLSPKHTDIFTANPQNKKSLLR
jgi:hypothetical protein